MRAVAEAAVVAETMVVELMAKAEASPIMTEPNVV